MNVKVNQIDTPRYREMFVTVRMDDFVCVCVYVCAFRFVVSSLGDGVDTMVCLYRFKRKIDENGV